jgi:glutathione S-transferase
MGNLCLRSTTDASHLEVTTDSKGKGSTTALSRTPIRLHYFNVRNRAEFIRWIFAYKGIPYEDVRIDMANWPKIKPTFEFQTVPVLEFDGKKLVTAIAIGRHIALKTGLYPSNPEEVYNSESLIDFIGDFLNVFDKLAFKENNWGGWDEYLRTEGIQRLKIVEARLKRNRGRGGFFVGSSVSLVDFVVAAYLHSHYFLTGQEQRLKALSREVPELKAFVDHFLQTLPPVTSYIATRPASLA